MGLLTRNTTSQRKWACLHTFVQHIFCIRSLVDAHFSFITRVLIVYYDVRYGDTLTYFSEECDKIMHVVIHACTIVY